MWIDHVIKCIHAKLFVWGFSSHSRNFHSFGDVTVTDEGILSALKTIKQRGILSVPYLLWDGPTLYNGHLQGSVTLEPWQWSCYYLFIRLRSVPTGDRTNISRVRRQTHTIPNSLCSLFFITISQHFINCIYSYFSQSCRPCFCRD